MGVQPIIVSLLLQDVLNVELVRRTGTTVYKASGNNFDEPLEGSGHGN